ncbi:hypothetical protein AJ78_04513 [Emergomyces pasteurianus Ep9510]|uniref:Zn(2)-C6 fungal-type domain-containing protein n=1 Tax=Emergomyces pasteurianus Ep9510 TaxID=1447872 RepID=A0A1J9PGT8_9EURO|nr:hypothetical protein AJ78_04513 [Emergomyces pasteurianus Ep9510]
MHSVRSAGRPLPFTPFQAHGSGSDPLGFSLNLNLSDISCHLSLRAPYLSPPMSGSPSPEYRFDPLRRDRRRKRSNSPISSTAHGTAHSLLSYVEPPAGAPGPDVLLPHSRRLSVGQPGMSIIGLPVIDDSQLRHTIETGALLPQGTTPLPPRSTRRAKAHVASACVNCKRKHLGCDSARPCRRCISAGKEESCVDVRHKRRGRPPLKAEEGPLRPYDPVFSHPGVPHLQLQSSSPGSQFHGHKRTYSSREIRPSTDLQLLRRASEIGSEYGRPMPNPGVSNPHTWAPPPTSRGMRTSPPRSSSFVGQTSLSSSPSHRSPVANAPLFSSGAGSSPAFTPEYGDLSGSVPPFHSERISSSHAPSQFQRPHIPSLPAVSSQGPLSSPPLSVSSGARNYPFSGPGQSQIQLPPLMPSTTGSEIEYAQSSQRPPIPPPAPSLPFLQSSQPNLGRVDHTQDMEGSRPVPPHPPFEPATLSTGPVGRGLLDPYRPLPLPPPPLPQQESTPQRESSFLTSNTLPPILEDKSSPATEREGEPESRPAKRRKMALGDMVND